MLDVDDIEQLTMESISNVKKKVYWTWPFPGAPATISQFAIGI